MFQLHLTAHLFLTSNSALASTDFQRKHQTASHLVEIILSFLKYYFRRPKPRLMTIKRNSENKAVSWKTLTNSTDLRGPHAESADDYLWAHHNTSVIHLLQHKCVTYWNAEHCTCQCWIMCTSYMYRPPCAAPLSRILSEEHRGELDVRCDLCNWWGLFVIASYLRHCGICSLLGLFKASGDL